jgi:hypothetical protein
MTVPIQPAKPYNFAENNIMVAGRSISGFDDDGTVSYEFQDDRYTHSVGADGQTTVSKTNDPRVVATITVKETGKGYEILSQLHAQQGTGPVPDPITYLHRDPINGDLVKDNFAIFLAYPGIEKAKEAGSREFTLLLPTAAERVQFAGQTPGGGQ